MTGAGCKKWESVIWRFIGDEAEGLPEDWECPDCWISMSDFEPIPF